MSTDIVDKTGTIGIPYATVKKGVMFKHEDRLFLKLDTKDADSVEVTTGRVFGLSDHDICYPAKIKIYITKLLAE